MSDGEQEVEDPDANRSWADWERSLGPDYSKQQKLLSKSQRPRQKPRWCMVITDELIPQQELRYFETFEELALAAGQLSITSVATPLFGWIIQSTVPTPGFPRCLVHPEGRLAPTSKWPSSVELSTSPFIEGTGLERNGQLPAGSLDEPTTVGEEEDSDNSELEDEEFPEVE